MDRNYIFSMLTKQLSNFYHLSDEECALLGASYEPVMLRVEHSFSKSTNKYYSRLLDGVKTVYFDPLHSCQWLMFLYFYANTIFRESLKLLQVNIVENNTDCPISLHRELCDKLYGISKVVSGADIYYEVSLPDVFTCDHPVGTVLGRAVYGDYFSFTQGCTVGNNHDIYPVLGTHVAMKSN